MTDFVTTLPCIHVYTLYFTCIYIVIHIYIHCISHVFTLYFTYRSCVTVVVCLYSIFILLHSEKLLLIIASSFDSFTSLFQLLFKLRLEEVFRKWHDAAVRALTNLCCMSSLLFVVFCFKIFSFTLVQKRQDLRFRIPPIRHFSLKKVKY